MVRYTPDDFLTEYSKFLTKANTAKVGSVELTMKRYDATDENNLPATNDKTGLQRKKTTKAQLKKGAANPENNKTKGKNTAKKAIQLTKKQITPDSESSTPLKEPAVLIRARFGSKKVSCVVPNKEVIEFNDQFATLFRLHNKSLVPQGQVSTRLKARKQASDKKGKATK